jgi:hypothetical protein
MKLELRVVEACGLSHLNQHDNIYPYCLIQLSKSSQIQRTNTMDCTTNPIWNAEFTFDVRRQRDSLKIFVKDSSKGRSHSVLATVTLGLQSLNPGSTVDQWFKLTPVKGVKAGGQIHLVLHLERTPVCSHLPRLLLPSANCAEAPATENEPQEILSPPAVVVEPIPRVTTPDKTGQQSSEFNVFVISGDFGEIIDTTDPNELATVKTGFSDIRESPAKMYTADAMEFLQLEKEFPIYGPHWAIAKISAFSAHHACDYFTEFAVSGCEISTKTWVLAMKKFFDESNHDINRNRIQFRTDTHIGPLMNAVFAAYDATIAAMARKKTLLQARQAINEAGQIINAIADDPAQMEDYKKAEGALLKGCQSYAEREDAAFWRNLQGARPDSLGVSAATSALGLSSLEHTLNCYICNSFGSRIQLDEAVQCSKLRETTKLRASQSEASIRFVSGRAF